MCCVSHACSARHNMIDALVAVLGCEKCYKHLHQITTALRMNSSKECLPENLCIFNNDAVLLYVEIFLGWYSAIDLTRHRPLPMSDKTIIFPCMIGVLSICQRIRRYGKCVHHCYHNVTKTVHSEECPPHWVTALFKTQKQRKLNLFLELQTESLNLERRWKRCVGSFYLWIDTPEIL